MPMPNPEPASLETGGVRGFLHRPEQSVGRGVVLTHGAGSDCNAPILVRLAGALCAAGYTVLRCDLPFRQQRRRGPPTLAKSAEDRAGLKAAAAMLRDLAQGDVLLGGHSYGGRQATILAAEEPKLAADLVLLSYPLHPPSKPDQLRVQHFPRLKTPCLFFHGTADPFDIRSFGTCRHFRRLSRVTSIFLRPETIPSFSSGLTNSWCAKIGQQFVF